MEKEDQFQNFPLVIKAGCFGQEIRTVLKKAVILPIPLDKHEVKYFIAPKIDHLCNEGLICQTWISRQKYFHSTVDLPKQILTLKLHYFCLSKSHNPPIIGLKSLIKIFKFALSITSQVPIVLF